MHPTELVKTCRIALRVVSREPGVTDGDIMDAEYCIGYFEGISAVLRDNPNGRVPVCIPDDVQTGTLIRVYLKYMDQNPKAFDLGKRFTVYVSLMANYPCKTASK